MARLRLPPPVDPSIVRAQRELFRSWRIRVWLGLAALLTLGLVQLPLFGVVGFELALVAAAFGSLAGLDLGAALVRRAQAAAARPLDRAVPPWRLVLALAGRAPLAPLAVVVVPLAGAAVHGLWAPTCDWAYGLEAYAIMALASTVLGAGGGVVVGLWVGRTRGLGALAPFAVALALTALGLHRFYSEPPVFSYSPLVGFFPGNLYDEDIRLDPALYWARLEQLATVLALLAATALAVDAPTLRVRLRRRRHRLATGALAVAVPAALCALALRHHAGDLGYAIDAPDIWAELGGVHRTRHFIIHHDDRPDIAADIELIAADHELRLHQVCRTLGVDPARVGTIRSYVFASSEQKGRLMGARRVEMAKPWRREIYLTHEDFPHGSLRHEIAHVVAGTFGSAGFDVSARSVLGLPLLFNPGMIEGVAVAADWPGTRALTPHQSMRAMELLGFAPSAREVLGVRFLTLSSARSYTAAGSFIRFLLDRHGPAPLRALYASGGDFDRAYGTSQAELVRAWREMLATVEVPAADLEAARERFRQRGILQRPCPHANAQRMRRAAQAAGERRAEAIALVRAVCRDEPDEPRYRMILADLLARGAPDEVAEARAIYDAFAAGERGAVLAAEGLSSLATLDGRGGELAAVRGHVERALALPLDDERRRPFEALARALDGPGLGGVFLRGYFFARGGGGLTWALAAAVASGGGDGGGDDGDGALAWYLVGLRAAERGEHTLAAWALDAAFARGLPTPRFVRNAARRLAVSAWRAGDRRALDTALAALTASAYETDRALADDWRERAAFTPPPP